MGNDDQKVITFDFSFVIEFGIMEKKKIFLESFSLFNELSVVAWLIVLILVKKFPVMRESRDYFAVTLDLFQLFV